MPSHIIHTDPNQEYYFKEGCHILELLNSDKDETLSIARARVEPSKTTRAHTLDNVTERYVILQGEGRVEIDNLPATTVTAGDVVIIKPGCTQRITNMGNTDLVFLAICTPRFTAECYQELESHGM